MAKPDLKALKAKVKEVKKDAKADYKQAKGK